MREFLYIFLSYFVRSNFLELVRKLASKNKSLPKIKKAYK